jgi:hypothetical protein
MRRDVEKVILVHENVNIQKKLFYGLSLDFGSAREGAFARRKPSFSFYRRGFHEELLKETSRALMERNLKSFILELDDAGKKVSRVDIQINTFLFCLFHAFA